MTMHSLYSQRKWWAVALCCGLSATSGKAQTGLLVSYYNGTEQNYSIAASGKLYFDNSNLQIAVSDVASPVSIPVSIIRKLTFTAAPLPLQLLSFTITSEKAQVGLVWKTENEVNTSHFVVERSFDGTTYESIGQVASISTGATHTYSFSDAAPKSGTSYYRLKLVDADGKFTYSKVLTVKRTTDELITLLPNPATNYIKINSTATDRVTVKIYTADGRLMLTGTYAPGESISISKLVPGMYLATVNDKTYKLIKH